LLYIALYCF
jgi:hypothetical protein